MTDILGAIDYPKEGDLIYTKDPNIYGWAFSKSENAIEIIISVDNKEIRWAGTGIARLDIEELYPDIPHSYESGFYAWINLEAFADGKHSLRVNTKTKDSQKLIGVITFDLKEKNQIFLVALNKLYVVRILQICD